MPRSRTLVIVCVAISSLASISSAEQLLVADFDDKTVDQAIGTGGAAVGEPVRVDEYVTATVRATPMATPALEISDAHDYYAGAVGFQLLGDAEISEGTVIVTADLWFAEIDAYQIIVRERDGASYSFASVYFSEYGSFSVKDEEGEHGIVGHYSAGRVIPIRMVFHMESATYDLYFDGEQLMEGVSHGITEVGIGSLAFGPLHDSNLVGTMYVDNIEVRTLDNDCLATAESLCLNDERFRVTARYATPQGASGSASAVALTGDTGYFWFFNPNNVEVVVKVLDGCSFNSRYWVFAAGMTNVEVDLTVEDTASGAIYTATNLMDQPFQPLQDTGAFATCP